MGFIKRSTVSGDGLKKLSQQELDELEEKLKLERQEKSNNECSGEQCTVETDNKGRNQ